MYEILPAMYVAGFSWRGPHIVLEVLGPPIVGDTLMCLLALGQLVRTKQKQQGRAGARVPRDCFREAKLIRKKHTQPGSHAHTHARK